MQLRIRILFAVIIATSFNPSIANAVIIAPAISAAKICGLKILQKFGGSCMVELSRIVMRGTALAIGDKYDKRSVRKFADLINDARTDILCKVVEHDFEEGAEGVKALLDPMDCLKSYHGSDEDPSLLHVALRAQHKNYGAAEFLLQLGIDPNVMGKAAFSNEQRPLIVEFARDPRALKLLLEYGADFDWLDDRGGSIYAELFQYEAWDSIRILHDRGLKLRPGDYLSALMHRDKLISDNYFNFLRQLSIRKRLPTTTFERITE